MTTRSFMKNKPQVVQAFTNAIYKGQQWVASHSSAEIAAVVLPQFPDSNAETLTQIIDRYKAQDTWKTEPVLDADGFERFQDILQAGGQLETRVKYEDMVNTDFAKAVH